MLHIPHCITTYHTDKWNQSLSALVCIHHQGDTSLYLLTFRWAKLIVSFIWFVSTVNMWGVEESWLRSIKIREEKDYMCWMRLFSTKCCQLLFFPSLSVIFPRLCGWCRVRLTAYVLIATSEAWNQQNTLILTAWVKCRAIKKKFFLYLWWFCSPQFLLFMTQRQIRMKSLQQKWLSRLVSGL